mmetsp:Transcript_29725/g.62109  ORF Transcript_29725/g.62109 Transcript_29725/m.62109 type:complete len:227 (-) Transcript_29725:3810-4490(-)
MGDLNFCFSTQSAIRTKRKQMKLENKNRTMATGHPAVIEVPISAEEEVAPSTAPILDEAADESAPWSPQNLMLLSKAAMELAVENRLASFKQELLAEQRHLLVEHEQKMNELFQKNQKEIAKSHKDALLQMKQTAEILETKNKDDLLQLNKSVEEMLSLDGQQPVLVPPGWRQGYSNSQKRYFYFHKETKHTQWHFPTASEAKDPKMAKKAKLLSKSQPNSVRHVD